MEILEKAKSWPQGLYMRTCRNESRQSVAGTCRLVSRLIQGKLWEKSEKERGRDDREWEGEASMWKVSNEVIGGGRLVGNEEYTISRLYDM